ncbi:hypothetical protein Ancab_014297 [Ancistrocladus abbreviatus]
MEVVVQSSSPSSTHRSPTTNDGLYQHTVINNRPLSSAALDPFQDHLDTNTQIEGEEERRGGERKRQRQREEEEEEEEEGDQLSLLGLFVTVFRKSLFGCRNWCEREGFSSASSTSYSSASCSKMEIGMPTNVRHVAHVTFDRFNGFLGLPVEFEPEVPRRAPSASATVFGVSTNSMQLSFDSRGNSVPTILLLMQRRLYALGGLEVEGIFRINPGNGQEEYVRDRLNKGVVPEDADVHCLAGLIKAWFRELPTGLLDCLSPEQLMQSQTEEECAWLARLLPATEAALLDWTINLMADVAQYEHLNKMNARNIAVVFAPNMTHVLDPLTALMHAVQVMNFLKTLIVRTLKEREDSALDLAPTPNKDPWDENGQFGPLPTILEEANEAINYEGKKHDPATKKPTSEETPLLAQNNSSPEREGPTVLLSSIENVIPRNNQSLTITEPFESDGPTILSPERANTTASSSAVAKPSNPKARHGHSGKSIATNIKKGQVKVHGKTDQQRNIVSRINQRMERIEAWR